MLALLFYLSEIMQLNNKTDNESSCQNHVQQRKPQVAAITLQLSSAALEWLNETTLNNADESVSHYALFYDMICRMRTDTGSDHSFRRPISLSSGQLQFSEEQLAADWNIGRKRVRGILARMADLGIISITSSRVASYASVACVTAWCSHDGVTAQNPVIEAQNGLKSAVPIERS
jgi:hypothetical protein